MSPGTPATAWYSHCLLPHLGQTEGHWWGPEAPFEGDAAPLPHSAQHPPAQEGSRRSPFLKDRRGLRLAPLPTVSTPSGRDLPSFSFDFWGKQRSISAWGHPKLPLPFPQSSDCLSALSRGLGLQGSSREGTQHHFFR